MIRNEKVEKKKKTFKVYSIAPSGQKDFKALTNNSYSTIELRVNMFSDFLNSCRRHLKMTRRKDSSGAKRFISVAIAGFLHFFPLLSQPARLPLGLRVFHVTWRTLYFHGVRQDILHSRSPTRKSQLPSRMLVQQTCPGKVNQGLQNTSLLLWNGDRYIVCIRSNYLSKTFTIERSLTVYGHRFMPPAPTL